MRRIACHLSKIASRFTLHRESSQTRRRRSNRPGISQAQRTSRVTNAGKRRLASRRRGKPVLPVKLSGTTDSGGARPRRSRHDRLSVPPHHPSFRRGSLCASSPRIDRLRSHRDARGDRVRQCRGPARVSRSRLDSRAQSPLAPPAPRRA